jgi:hypothetical protein
MSHPSASDANPSSYSQYQAEMENFVESERRTANDTIMSGKNQVELEEMSFGESFGLIRRGCSVITWQIIRGIKPRVLPIPVVLSLCLCAWYGFPYSSFPFKIW